MVISAELGSVAGCSDTAFGICSSLQFMTLSQRHAGECAVLAEHPEGSAIVRTSAVFGLARSRSRDGNFISKCVDAARKTGRLEVAVENTLSPTYAADLASALIRLLGLPNFFPGVYHLTNEGTCSWFELAQYAVRELKIACKLIPVDRGSRSGDMLRPRQSVMANTRAAALGLRLPAWQDAVSRYLAAIEPRGGAA